MNSSSAQRLFLEPNNDLGYENLKNVVIEGIDTENMSVFNENESPLSEAYLDIVSDGEGKAYVWGLKEENRRFNFFKGDIILFQSKNDDYVFASIILDGLVDEALASELWTVSNEPGNWNHILFLSPPIPVGITKEDISSFVEHAGDWRIGFSPLNEDGHQAIRSRYGTILDFINSHSLQEKPKKQLSLAKIDTSEEIFVQKKHTAEITPEDLNDGIPEWYAELKQALNTRKQVRLHGSVNCISSTVLTHFSNWVGEDLDDGASVHVEEIPIGKKTRYENVIEKVTGTPGNPVQTNSPISGCDRYRSDI